MELEFRGHRRSCKSWRLSLTREKQYTKGKVLQHHQGMTVSFYLFLSSGIWGVMEIIYHLMGADGFIKLNQKAFTEVLSVWFTWG